MIHSLSGGVIAENGIHKFVKVDVEGVPCWFLAQCAVEEGDRVLVPEGYLGEKEGVVLRVEFCTAQTAPVPVKRAREIIRVVGKA